MALTVFHDTLRERLAKISTGLTNKGLIESFGGIFENLKAFLEIFDRKEDLQKLSSLKGKEHKASEWAAPKSRMELLGAWERDVRLRYGTRIDCYRSTSLEKKLIPLIIKRYAEQVEGLEKNGS